eukprot:CAMPEP_0194423884 /NCGR_PEP_ID=MMETSP0176-20130528/23154_1 /TAXON_ID=216777 /ORGANISM="Proboscia alata, Strain PI-D3" /LENGTH=954 /DNA_ID=CAMNT_0039233351 /DNA_START=11 /DNA_END=2875 /DNA_ORIENTATION=-
MSSPQEMSNQQQQGGQQQELQLQQEQHELESNEQRLRLLEQAANNNLLVSSPKKNKKKSVSLEDYDIMKTKLVDQVATNIRDGNLDRDVEEHQLSPTLVVPGSQTKLVGRHDLHDDYSHLQQQQQRLAKRQETHKLKQLQQRLSQQSEGLDEFLGGMSVDSSDLKLHAPNRKPLEKRLVKSRGYYGRPIQDDNDDTQFSMFEYDDDDHSQDIGSEYDDEYYYEDYDEYDHYDVDPDLMIQHGGFWTSTLICLWQSCGPLLMLFAIVGICIVLTLPLLLFAGRESNDGYSGAAFGGNGTGVTPTSSPSEVSDGKLLQTWKPTSTPTAGVVDKEVVIELTHEENGHEDLPLTPATSPQTRAPAPYSLEPSNQPVTDRLTNKPSIKPFNMIQDLTTNKPTISPTIIFPPLSSKPVDSADNVFPPPTTPQPSMLIPEQPTTFPISPVKTYTQNDLTIIIQSMLAPSLSDEPEANVVIYMSHVIPPEMLVLYKDIGDLSSLPQNTGTTVVDFRSQCLELYILYTLLYNLCKLQYPWDHMDGFLDFYTALLDLGSGMQIERDVKEQWMACQKETDKSWLYGVTCKDGVVVGLDWSNNHLDGSLPEVIAGLSHLKLLNLSKNLLSGSIPESLSQLTSLVQIQFGTNSLSGSIPPTMGNMSQLTLLYLEENNLTGTLPTQLGLLTNLKALSLFNNKLEGKIPFELSDLTNLNSLFLDNNKLKGNVPYNLFISFHEIIDLRFKGNSDLTGTIPSFLKSMTNLSRLYLDGCQFTGSLPTEIGYLTSLTQLHLHKNDLEGSLPSELGSLKLVEELWLDNNRFRDGIPTELGMLTKMESLFLYRNELGTQNNNGVMVGIPTEIGLLFSSLKVLHLNANRIRGTIPTQLGLLTRLETLELDTNTLEGTVPDDLGTLSKLKEFTLFENRLTGIVPDSVCDLTDQTLQSGVLEKLATDCELECDCCTCF